MKVVAGKSRAREIAVLTVAVSMAQMAHAAIYDESSVGDFHAGQFYTLTDTHNSFVGRQKWGSDPVDGFRFVVQEGYEATIHFNFSYLDLSPGEAQAWVWDLGRLAAGAGACTPSSSPFGEYGCTGSSEGAVQVTSQIFRSAPDIGVPTSWEFVDFDQVTLSAGTYILYDNFGFVRPGSGGAITGSLSYSIDIDQTAVPVPAAAWLLGSGLMGLAAIARRRKSA